MVPRFTPAFVVGPPNTPKSLPVPFGPPKLRSILFSPLTAFEALELTWILRCGPERTRRIVSSVPPWDTDYKVLQADKGFRILSMPYDYQERSQELQRGIARAAEDGITAVVSYQRSESDELGFQCGSRRR